LRREDFAHFLVLRLVGVGAQTVFDGQLARAEGKLAHLLPLERLGSFQQRLVTGGDDLLAGSQDLRMVDPVLPLVAAIAGQSDQTLGGAGVEEEQRTDAAVAFARRHSGRQQRRGFQSRLHALFRVKLAGEQLLDAAATFEPEPTVGSAPHGIAHLEPAVGGEDFGGLAGIAPVASEHEVAAHFHFTGAFRHAGDGDDADLGARKRLAQRTHLEVIEQVDAPAASTFGRAVAFAQLDADVLEELGRLSRNRSAARDAHDDVVEPCLGQNARADELASSPATRLP